MRVSEFELTGRVGNLGALTNPTGEDLSVGESSRFSTSGASGSILRVFKYQKDSDTSSRLPYHSIIPLSITDSPFYSGPWKRISSCFAPAMSDSQSQKLEF